MELREGYIKTEVGTLPVDWELKPFYKITDAITCGVAATPKYVDESEGKPFLSASHVQNGKVIPLDYKYIPVELYNQITKHNKPEKGDILYTRVGAGIGEAGVIDFDLDFAIYVSLTLIKPKKNLNSYYLKSLLNSDYYRFLAKRDQFAGGGVQNLNVGVVREFPIPIPPTIEEQIAIATALSDADALINSLEKLIAKKRNIKQGAMQQLLKPKEGWEVKKLGDLTKVFTKQTGFDYTAYIKPSLVQYRTNDTIPFIQNKDFNNRWINFDTDYFIPKIIAIQFPKILLNEKSLLISISGSVGNVGLYDSQELAFIGGAVAILKFKDSDLIDWIMVYLKSIEGQKKLLDNVKAGSHQNLILDDIRKIEIPFPKHREQTRISTILSDMDAEIQALVTKLEKYRKIKLGMMQNLLTGKIRLI